MRDYKHIDLVNQRFGKLVVIEYYNRNKQKEIIWKCKCDCGKECFVSTACLRKGNTTSCGCKRKELSKKQSKERIGEIKVMNNGLKATIIEYINYENITVQFENGKIRKSASYREFRGGNLKSPMIYETIGDCIKCENPNIGLKFLIDKEDINKLGSGFWCVQCNGYIINSSGILLHRLIMDCPEGMTVDHINHDILDNRKANLRICTLGQNNFNKGMIRSNTSGYKGVVWAKKNKKWMARIAINGKQIYIGIYSTKEEAYAAYCEAAKKYHGEFARLA